MSKISDITSAFEFHLPTSRQKFLQLHGFQRDPFRFHVTEQAWGLQRSFSEKDASITDWLTEWCDQFQHPNLEHDPPKLQFPLSEDVPLLLLMGAPGSGKTALLYHRMAQAYQDHSKTLVIFYDFTELIHHPTPSPIQEYQSRAVVVAMVLHLLRDFTDYRREDVQQWLKRLIVIGGVVVQWWIQELLQKDDPRRTTWQLLRHPLLHPLDITQARRTLLEEVCRVPSEPASPPNTREFTDNITPILEALNIRQLHLYIDNLTQEGLDQEWIRAHIHSIMKEDHLYDKKVQRIITVPSDLAEYYRNWLADEKGYFSFLAITIRWTPTLLYSLLRKRCCADRERANLFDGATESEPSSLENHIIDQARESPRRLLMMVSALLDAHTICTPSTEQLTESLWEYVRSHWEFEGSPPEALPQSGLA